jgi:hypothetical protein
MRQHTMFNSGKYKGLIVTKTDNGYHQWTAFVGGCTVKSCPVYKTMSSSLCSYTKWIKKNLKGTKS